MAKEIFSVTFKRDVTASEATVKAVLPSTTRMSKYGLHLSYLRLLCQRERKKSPIQKKKRNGYLFQGAGLLTSSYCIVAAGMTNEGSRKSSVVIPGLS